jgi:hypothetical protein
MIHALFVVNSHLADKRADRILHELKEHRSNSLLKRI